MSGGHSKSESESETGFKQGVWDQQGKALNNLYKQMGGLFSQTNAGMQGQTPGATNWMNQIRDQSNPAWQQQMGGGAYQGMDLQNDYRDALNTGGGNEQFINQSIMGGAGNDYVDAMRGNFMTDASDAQNQMMKGLDARAAASGMSGGSRHGTATAQGMKDINQNLQQNLNSLGYQSFDKDLDRKLGIAQRADTYDMNRLNNISGMMGQQQNAMQGGLNYGGQMQNLGMGSFAPYMMPWQAANQYAGTIGSPTVLGSGSMTGSSDSKSMQGGMG